MTLPDELALVRRILRLPAEERQAAMEQWSEPRRAEAARVAQRQVELAIARGSTR